MEDSAEMSSLSSISIAPVLACNRLRPCALYLLRACRCRGSDAGLMRAMNDSAESQTFAASGTNVDAPAPSLSPGEEAELVLRAKTDPAAFGELYEAHYSAILNYLYRRTLRVAVAEELTSNTFFKALQGLGGYEQRQGVRFRSWLYRIATNEARMYWRGRRGGRREVLPLLDGEDLGRVTFVWPETESAEAVRERQRQFAGVHEALRGLPEPYQAAIVLRYFEGLGHEQIAGIMGKRPGTIKSLVHRGLAKLGKAMAGMDATG